MARTAKPHLDIPSNRLGFIILKAREFDMKESDGDPDEDFNPTDDGNIDTLTDESDDPVREELLGAIRELPEDERLQLVALAWLGRGTYDLSEWRTALDTARSEHRKRAAEYLLGLPLLGDYLEDGRAMFDDDMVDDAGAGVVPAAENKLPGPAHGNIKRHP